MPTAFGPRSGCARGNWRHTRKPPGNSMRQESSPPTGKKWTAGNLRSYTRRHGIPRHECPADPPPLWDGSPERALEDTPSYEAIVRCIEHGNLAQHAALRRRIRRDPTVRALVRRVSGDNLNHPYDAFSYGFWLQYAKHA